VNNAIWPGTALSLVVIATNFLGDALSDRRAAA
jgi:ABC-type dipeptide/oligopeptide/nickel transport system permease subunit